MGSSNASDVKLFTVKLRQNEWESMEMLMQVKFFYKMEAPVRLQLSVDGLPPWVVTATIIKHTWPGLISLSNNGRQETKELAEVQEVVQLCKKLLEEIPLKVPE